MERLGRPPRGQVVGGQLSASPRRRREWLIGSGHAAPPPPRKRMPLIFLCLSTYESMDIINELSVIIWSRFVPRLYLFSVNTEAAFDPRVQSRTS